jgi:hypothetical protein
MIDSTHNDLYDDIIWLRSPQVWVTYGRKIDFWPFSIGYFGIFGDVYGLKSCQYWYPIANTWFPHPNNYYKPDYNLLLPYLHLKLILHMAKNDKNHVFTAFFLAFFGVFCWSESWQYGSIGYNFCFTHADNHYKPHYKLLTPYVHLILTLYIVKNDKNHFFYVFEVLVQDSISTRLMKRWEYVLWRDGSPTLFPWLPRRNQLVWYLRTQGIDLKGPIFTVRDRRLYYGLGSFHPGATPPCK